MVEVQDTGRGIDFSEQKRIFKSQLRADSRDNNEMKPILIGVGVGLTNSKILC